MELKIYIDKEGVARWSPTGWPEEPEFKGDHFLHYGPQKKYEYDLQKAKSESIRFNDQDGVIDLAGEKARKPKPFDTPRPDTFHTIQYDGEVEVYEDMQSEYGGDYIARLIPTVKEESQEELWKELIDIYDDADRQSYGYGLIMNRLKEKFILTRKD